MDMQLYVTQDNILWRWGWLLPIVNVFHFYYLLWGEASEGVSGGEGQRRE